MTDATRTPVELIPGRPQTLWGWPAVVNFACGGAGAGLYLAAVLQTGLGPGPAVGTAAWLGPLLVLAGFVAVAAEARRPSRGPRVLARVATSWMSRELWIGGAFVALAGTELVAPRAAFRGLAWVAALGLALAQGVILRRARAVAAWDVPVMPAIFLASAALSGAGLLMLVEVVGGRAPEPATLGATMFVLVVGALAWLGYVTWSREPAFARATAPLREGGAAVAIVAGGYLVPFLLFGLALALPAIAAPAATLGGALLLAGQAQAKSVLILASGQLRPITLANLRLERRTS
jgi:formate-dependent nitrite reductase membrane component NrfD